MDTIPVEYQQPDERRQRWLRALLNATGFTSGTLDMHEILKAVASEVLAATGGYALNSFLFPERAERGNYYLIDPLPPDDYLVPDPPDRFTSEALRTGKPVIATDVMSHPLTDKRTMSRFGVVSALAFPIVFRGETVAAGFLCFDRPHEFSDEEVEVVMGIASAAAMSVANARLHKAKVELAVSQERARIAQELHDQVCQTLATVKINLNTLPYLAKLDGDASKLIEQTKELVDESYDDVRDIIGAFRAAGVPSDDVASSIAGYLKTLAAGGNLEVRNLVEEGHLAKLNSSARLQLVRIVGEALSNVRKHARASCVTLSSADDGESVTIEVVDDGCGLGPSAEEGDGEHFGIAIMRERASAARGELDICSIEPHGTSVRVRFPYR